MDTGLQCHVIDIYVKKNVRESNCEAKGYYTYFIDYSKAFDTVRSEPPIDLPQAVDVDCHDVQLLANLYWIQKAAVCHKSEISEWMSIKQGVRQGCVASPHLFAMYNNNDKS